MLSRTQSQGKLFKKGEDISLTLQNFKSTNIIDHKLNHLIHRSTNRFIHRVASRQYKVNQTTSQYKKMGLGTTHKDFLESNRSTLTIF